VYASNAQGETFNKRMKSGVVIQNLPSLDSGGSGGRKKLKILKKVRSYDLNEIRSQTLVQE
jgi:hypothetical protein